MQSTSEQRQYQLWLEVNTDSGSGSLEQDGPVLVVAMKKEEQTSLVHDHRLGKRERHTHKAGQALTERVIPAIYVGGLSCLFAYGCVLLLRDHRLVCCPEVREAMPPAVG